ncbi:hypothetical protein [Nocardia yunnanensis]|uniref:hypothetical protein n=1 Tax=Nocardia yunnanensis TaxID=2382165 RepID=UPI00319DBDFB
MYFVIPLLIVAGLVAVVHLRESRERPLSRVLVGVVAVLAIAASVATTVQVYRIGESGAQAVWNGVAQQPARTHPTSTGDAPC